MAAISSLSGEWAGYERHAVAHFDELGAAGTYTVTVPLPPRSQLTNVRWLTDVQWGAGTSATLDVGDDADDDHYLDGKDIKDTTLYFDLADFAADPLYYAQGGNINVRVVTVGTTSTAGRSHVIVSYMEYPAIRATATKV